MTNILGWKFKYNTKINYMIGIRVFVKKSRQQERPKQSIPGLLRSLKLSQIVWSTTVSLKSPISHAFHRNICIGTLHDLYHRDRRYAEAPARSRWCSAGSCSGSRSLRSSGDAGLLSNLRFLNGVNKFRPVISGIFSDSPERVRNQCQNSTLIDTVLCRA